ncbi:MAG: ABC transporter ATP-binding protein [Cyanobacteria bacterium P01_H01_bin.121]
MTDTLLQLETLRIAYPVSQRQPEPVWAVDSVCLELKAGERLGLVGESGCGKSTLGKAVLRLLPQASQIEGNIHFAGQPLTALRNQQLQHFRGEAVGLVFQDPMTRLNPMMTVGAHCLETLRSHRPELSKRQAQARVLETLDAVKIPPNRWQQYPHEFSGGMRQRVAIALALLLNPKLIVADEPTTSLDVTVSAQILQELTRLCSERQMALLLISHDLALVGQYCDRLAVMYQGKLVEIGPTQTLLQQPQHPYTQQLLASALHLHQNDESKNEQSNEQTADTRAASATAAPLLELQTVEQHYALEQNPIAQILSRQRQVVRAVDGVSFALEAGETLGLVGESGCGKSTLCRTVLRLLQPTGGTIRFLDRDLATFPNRSLRLQMQMIFQDPHACLNPLMTIGQSIADPLRIHQLAPPSEHRTRVEAMLTRVGLTPAEQFYNRYPHEISGGQQQRVAIARALVTEPKLLVCDEPVSMLDATVQAQVLELMLELKRSLNLTYLFVTHDLSVARFFCDRIAVMTGGKIVELGPTEQVFREPKHPYTRSLLAAAPLLSSLPDS